jgi:hypothetical protein
MDKRRQRLVHGRILTSLLVSLILQLSLRPAAQGATALSSTDWRNIGPSPITNEAPNFDGIIAGARHSLARPVG